MLLKTTPHGLNSDKLARIHELCLAMYCSLLLIWFEESKSFAWPTRYLFLWHPHAVNLSRIDFLLFYSEVFGVLAVAVFLCLLLMRSFSFSRRFERIAGGVLAFAGFPLASLFRGNPLFLVTMLLVGGICFLSWAQRRWFVSDRLAIFLLVIYYLSCWILGGRVPIESRPSGAWTIGDHAWAAYPLVGIAYTLVWAVYFRDSNPVDT